MATSALPVHPAHTALPSTADFAQPTATARRAPMSLGRRALRRIASARAAHPGRFRRRQTRGRVRIGALAGLQDVLRGAAPVTVPSHALLENHHGALFSWPAL